MFAPFQRRTLARRLAVAGGALSVLIASGLVIWWFALPVWLLVRPDVRVRYLLTPHPDGGDTWRLEYEAGDTGWIIDRSPADLPADSLDLHWSRGRGWNLDRIGATWSDDPVAVRRLAPAGEWVELREGDAVLLAVVTEADGTDRPLRVWCVPREVTDHNAPPDWEPPPGKDRDRAWRQVVEARAAEYVRDRPLPVPPP